MRKIDYWYYNFLKWHIILLLFLTIIFVVTSGFQSIVHAQSNPGDYTELVGYSFCPYNGVRVPQYCTGQWCLEKDPNRTNLQNYPLCTAVNSDTGYACTTEKDCPRDILCRQSFEDTNSPTFTCGGYTRCINNRCVSFDISNDLQWSGAGPYPGEAGDKIRYTYINEACMARGRDFDGVVRREVRARDWYIINKYDDVSCEETGGVGRFTANLYYKQDIFDGSRNSLSFYIHDVDRGFPGVPLEQPGLPSTTRRCRNEVPNNNDLWNGVGCGTFYDTLAISSSNFRNVNTANFSSGNVRFDAGTIQRGKYMVKIRLQGVDTSSSGVPDSTNWPKPCTILVDQGGWNFPAALGLGNNYGQEVISGLPRTDDDCTAQYGSHYISNISSSWSNGGGGDARFTINFRVIRRPGWGDSPRKVNVTTTMWYMQPIIDEPARRGELSSVLVADTVCANAAGQSSCGSSSTSANEKDIVRDAWITPATIADTLVDTDFTYVAEPGTKIYTGVPNRWYLYGIVGVNQTGSCQKQGHFAVKCIPRNNNRITGSVFRDDNWNGTNSGTPPFTPSIRIIKRGGGYDQTFNGTSYNATNLSDGTYDVFWQNVPAGWFVTGMGNPPPEGSITVAYGDPDGPSRPAVSPGIFVSGAAVAAANFYTAPMPTGLISYSGTCSPTSPTTCNPGINYQYSNVPACSTDIFKNGGSIRYNGGQPNPGSFIDANGVNYGQNYLYENKVSGVCPYLQGRVLDSMNLNVSFPCPTSAPTGLANLSVPACGFGTTTAIISWNPVANATWYDVRVDDGTASDTADEIGGTPNNCAPHDICINQWATTSMNIRILPGRTYTWWVHAGAAFCPQTARANGPNLNVPVCNLDPIGYLEGASCTNFNGWTCDANDYNAALPVHFYRDGPAGGGGTFVGSTTANVPREPGVAAACGGNPNHGFSVNPASLANGASLFDGITHRIYAHPINTPPGNNPNLRTGRPPPDDQSLPIICGYTISGNVFEDNNRNGLYEPLLGETTLVSGVPITLTGPRNTSVNSNAGPSPNYSFTLLPVGLYTVSIPEPPKANYTAVYPGSLPLSRTVRLTPAGATVNFGVVRTYNVTGQIQVDAGAGCTPLVNPPYPPITVRMNRTSPPPASLTSSASPNYSFLNLIGGNYVLTLDLTGPYIDYNVIRVTVASPPPPETYPVNFSPLAADEVVNICISNIKPWWQTGGGDVRMRVIRNKVAPGQNASNGVPPSMFFSSGNPLLGTADFLPGSASGGTNTWVVNSEYGYNSLSSGKVGKISYSYLTSGAAGLTIQTHSCSGTCDIPNPGGGSFGAYKTDAASGSTITLESPGGSIINAVGNKKILLLHDGNIEITDRIDVDSGSILIIAASGNITIDGDSGIGVAPSITTGVLEGIFSAEGNFVIENRTGLDCLLGIADDRLNIEGVVIANADVPFANTGGGIFDNRRDLCISNNKLYPSARVAPRLDFISSFPDELKSKSTLWQEVQP